VIKVVNTGANVVTIEGFGIREGTGDTSDYRFYPCGGGLYSNYANLVVANCRFQNNEADYGGGMYNENYSYGGTYSNSGYPSYAVVVRDCHFEDNGADYGGGMYNKEVAFVTVLDCTFEENYTNYHGGGMYNDNSNVVVESCTFERNDAVFSNGGGMYNYDSDVTVESCTFDRNEAGNEGGGMVNYYSGDASASLGGDTDYDGEILTEDIVTFSVSNCIFTNNEAGNRGGGMYNEEYSEPFVSKCVFVGNEAIRGGGGMHNHDYSAPVVTNCVFVANVVIGESDNFRGIDGQAEIIRSAGGGGMFSGPYATPVVTNCTFTLNTVPYYSNKGDYDGENGGGVKNANNSSAVFTNCILWGNVCGNNPNDVLNTDGNTSTFEYCNIGGGFPGEGNIDADPLFVNAPTNLSLGAGSPCIDTGTNLVSWGSLGGVMDDILGTPRPQRLGYDMGAYEYVGTSFSPVIIQPLARTQLQSVLSLWEELLSRLPEEPTDEMAALIAQIQEHVANAAQLTNPIYASGQLSKAAAAMQQLASLLA
ncbi:MAG: hypothetical protein KO463_05000, partial [Candidatus Methanofastidiosa archaeon]|nr:hypothetical protein [Candidatus Methanofastidiosa archaeon]